MATYTTNINLKKPAQSDKIRIADFNGNADSIDDAFGAGFGQSSAPSVDDEINSLASGLAIISNGDVHAAITAGQYVYVRGHSTLDDGLYIASSNISANGALSSSNLDADTSGGLNSLNNKIENTVSATVKQDNVDKIYFNRIGAFVFCNFDGYVLDNYDLGALVPSEFRPAVNTGFTALIYTSNSDNYIATCNANTNGKLLVRRKNTIDGRDTTVNGYSLYGSAVWCTV